MDGAAGSSHVSLMSVKGSSLHGKLQSSIITSTTKRDSWRKSGIVFFSSPHRPISSSFLYTLYTASAILLLALHIDIQICPLLAQAHPEALPSLFSYCDFSTTRKHKLHGRTLSPRVLSQRKKGEKEPQIPLTFNSKISSYSCWVSSALAKWIRAKILGG